MKQNIILLIFTCYLLDCILSKVPQTEDVKVNMYVGDDNYTKILREEFKKTDQYLIAIMFTNKNCQTCESFQSQLEDIQKEFIKNQIPIFRCQISQSIRLNEKFKIKRFPMIHFVLKKRKNDRGDFSVGIYKTNKLVTNKILDTAKYLKKVLQYKNQLLSTKDIKFRQDNMSLINTLEEIPNMNRIIINFDQLQRNYGIGENQLIEQIILNESFNNMVIVPLEQELFSFYKVSIDIGISHSNNKVTQKSWIVLSIKGTQQSQFSHISIQNQQIYKLSNQNIDLLSIFESFLLYSVQQFTQDIFSIQSKTMSVLNINKPIYLAVLDSIRERNKSQEEIDMLNKIMYQFQYQVNIFWTEAQINPQKKVLLGFNNYDQPPLFGKLIINSNQHKQPLKNLLNESAIFNKQAIRKRISQDLGYQIQLIHKIQQSIKQISSFSEIQVLDNINFQPSSSTINFVYCTYHNLSPSEIQNLSFLSLRFKKFYPNSKLIILTPPCLVNNQPIQQGLYLLFKQTKKIISQKVLKCIEIQNIIQQLTNSFATQINRISLLPEWFCVPEQQMRDYLMRIS